VGIHDTATGAVIRSIEYPDLIQEIAWHPDGRWIAVVGDTINDWNRAVRLIAPDTGEMTVLGRHKFKTAMVRFTSDGCYIMSAGWERELTCWNLQTHERVFSFAGAGFNQTWRADGAQCTITFPAVPQERLQFYAFDRPACRELARPGEEGLSAGAFSPNGRWLAVPSSRQVCVWDLTGSLEPARFRTSDHSDVLFSPDSSELFALSGPIGSAELQAWRLVQSSQPGEPPQISRVSVQVPTRLSGAAVTKEGLVLVSAEGIRVAPNGSTIKASPGKATASADGRWLAVTYSYSEEVTVYRLPDLERAANLVTEDYIGHVSFSPRDDELLVVNRSGLEWWDTTTWQRKRIQAERPTAEPYVFYTPDGTGLWKITNYRDSGLYDSRTLDSVLPLPRNVVPLALSANGEQLAVGVDDQRVQVWNLAELRGHFRALGLDWTATR
jgi:WD40 repeat protein